MDSGGRHGLIVGTGVVGGRQGHLSAGSLGCVAGSGVGPCFEDQHHRVVEGTAPRVVFTVWVALATTVVDTGTAELAEGSGVAAGFGEEVAAVAEHVGPLAEPWFGGCVPGAELPRGGDHLLVVGRAAQCGDLEFGTDAGAGQARHVEGLSNVLGDVIRDSLAA